MYKICVITSTRADFGILKPLIIALSKEKNVNLQVIATGTHVDKKHAYTRREIDEIKEENIEAIEYIEIIDSDTDIGILQTMANATTKIGQYLKSLQPDIVVLLGDRYEIFAVASACTILNIPIAHIGGGELTYGAFDEAFRHSITKMSALHFTSSDEYRKRVIQLGEMPESVFHVGSLSIENIENLDFYSKEELDKEFGLDISKVLLTTFHPVTKEINTQQDQLKALLDAIIEQDKYLALFTKSNADTDSSLLNEMIEAYASKYKDKIKIVPSLGIKKYMSVMRHCACVLGNSSSGILEAPSFKVPTINIGNRQKGRTQAKSVIQCSAKKNAIAKALQNLPNKANLENIVNPYAKASTKENIVRKLLIFLEKTHKKNYNKEFYTI